jgi:hypothetical protein
LAHNCSRLREYIDFVYLVDTIEAGMAAHNINIEYNTLYFIIAEKEITTETHAPVSINAFQTRFIIAIESVVHDVSLS